MMISMRSLIRPFHVYINVYIWRDEKIDGEDISE